MGNPPYESDIGIANGKIVSIGNPDNADRVMDAEGMAVAPGFIDTHSHSDFTLLADPSADGKILQGVTTEINGNCGMSGGPLIGAAMIQREADLREYGIAERWASLDEYLNLLAPRNPAINSATLIGHGNIRASVMGYTKGAPTMGQLSKMKSLVVDCINAGAIGMSTGLIYPPGVYTETTELIELCRTGLEAAKSKGSAFIYTTHMRSEGERLLESIEETIEIGRASGAHVHISHIKTAGRDNWHKADTAIELITKAKHGGVNLTCDRYPYIASATDLDSVLPSWTYEGGNIEELKRLSDPETRAKIAQEMSAHNRYWQDVRISTVDTDRNKYMEAMRLTDIASGLGKSPIDTIIDLLIEEQLRVGAVFDSMCDENLVKFLALPYCMIGSDSSARSYEGITAKGKPHPRTFGTFPRFLNMRKNDLSEAIKKITSLPALTFGIANRGMIKQGYAADIVVFDPDKIKDTADFDNPFQRPVGIRYVIVNGQIAVDDGDIMPVRAGRVLRHGNG